MPTTTQDPNYKTDDKWVVSAVNAPETATYAEKSILPTSVTGFWANVVNTNDYRDTAQENANFVDNRINWGKTVTNTTTSNGKTTKTYSDGTMETTDSGISSSTGTPDRNMLLDEQKNIYSEQEKLQADVSGKYDALKISGDTAYNQLVENTKTQFAWLRTQLTDANRRFEMKTSQGQYLNNGFRYTPQSSEGMVYDAEQAGLAKLGDLNLKESTALQMALEAKNNNDYKALADYTSAVRNIQNDRMNTIRDMTTQIKTIEDTDKNIRNMNANEAKFMQSMVDSYILTAGDMDANKTQEYYNTKSKELSELMGFTIAPEFIKAQVEWANASAKLEVNKDLTDANWFYTDSLGRPMKNAEWKQIPFAKEDWGTWIEGNMLNVGTYDENGNKVMKTYELAGGTKSYAETLKDLPPTQTNITITALTSAYSWPMSELLLTPDNTFLKTTNPAYKNVGNGGMQCAEFVNRITGTSFPSGKAAAKDDPSTLRVGSVASWMPAWAWEYWHAGIIVGESGDNWIIKSANLRGNGIVSIDTIPKSAIKGGYTTESVKNLPNEVSGVYDPLKDKQLTPIGTNKDGSGIFLDTRTNKTISWDEAKALYSSTVSQSGYTSEQQIFDSIFQNSGGASKVSGAEADLMKERAKEFAKQWLSQAQALLKYKWLNLVDNNMADTAIEYVNIGDNLGTIKPSNYEATIAKYINSNNMSGLNTYVNWLADDKVKSRYAGDAILSGDFNTGEQRTNKIIEIINRNKDKIGAFDGRVTDLLSKLKSDPDYQELKTILQMSQADTRKYFAGSAVTETEMKALADFIGGNTKMNPDNLIKQLTTILEDRKWAYRNQREWMIIPSNIATSNSQQPQATQYTDFSSI